MQAAKLLFSPSLLPYLRVAFSSLACLTHHLPHKHCIISSTPATTKQVQQHNPPCHNNTPTPIVPPHSVIATHCNPPTAPVTTPTTTITEIPTDQIPTGQITIEILLTDQTATRPQIAQRMARLPVFGNPKMTKLPHQTLPFLFQACSAGLSLQHRTRSKDLAGEKIWSPRG
jgi:hypothetical protein